MGDPYHFEKTPTTMTPHAQLSKPLFWLFIHQMGDAGCGIRCVSCGKLKGLSGV